MKRMGGLITGAVLALGMGSAWAEGEHEHEGAHREHHDEDAQAEQSLTGEVVDVFCYLSHPEQGLGKGHAGCAKKCIQNGLPAAIKVGDQLYLATMADHNPANQQLAHLAGQQVTVRGKILERDGQHLIAITEVEAVQ